MSESNERNDKPSSPAEISPERALLRVFWDAAKTNLLDDRKLVTSFNAKFAFNVRGQDPAMTDAYEV